jgi:nicotinamide-nucleotide amidase
MFSRALLDEAAALLDLMRAQNRKLATAESCTGGLIAALFTEIPGSSDVFERSFVTYSNKAKSDMIGVPAMLIASHGAVSREVAIAMADCALVHSPADIAVSATGLAGPGGGSADKPVGLVHLALARRGGDTAHRECRFGDIGRTQVRLAAVAAALELVREQVASERL